jgi:DNA repair protein RadA/Sms
MSWDSFDEVEINDSPKAASKPLTNNKPEKFSELTLPTYMRTPTGMNELDRVLGGGLVDGSVVLLSGEPGIGKSTLLLQISAVLASTRKVLYVSGEESKGQLKLRAERLDIDGESLNLHIPKALHRYRFRSSGICFHL